MSLVSCCFCLPCLLILLCSFFFLSLFFVVISEQIYAMLIGCVSVWVSRFLVLWRNFLSQIDSVSVCVILIGEILCF